MNLDHPTDYYTGAYKDRQIADLRAQLDASQAVCERLMKEADMMAKSGLATIRTLTTERDTALRELAELRERVEGGLHNLRSDVKCTIDLYESNGPQWTSRETGSEYYDASYVLDKSVEIIEKIDDLSALLTEPAAPKGGEWGMKPQDCKVGMLVEMQEALRFLVQEVSQPKEADSYVAVALKQAKEVLAGKPDPPTVEAAIVQAIKTLTENEGDSVEIPNPNPDFEGPDYVVICRGDWLPFDDQLNGMHFYGDTLASALQAALAAKEKPNE